MCKQKLLRYFCPTSNTNQASDEFVSGCLSSVLAGDPFQDEEEEGEDPSHGGLRAWKEEKHWDMCKKKLRTSCPDYRGFKTVNVDKPCTYCEPIIKDRGKIESDVQKWNKSNDIAQQKAKRKADQDELGKLEAEYRAAQKARTESEKRGGSSKDNGKGKAKADESGRRRK